MLLTEFLEVYTLSRELKPSTEKYYRRTVGVLAQWLGRQPTKEDLSIDLVNRFLAEKQREGRSAYYRKSLRNGLRSLLQAAGVEIPRGRLRTVKLNMLAPEAWSPAEVSRLVEACDSLPEAEQRYFRTMILAAYYTGASQIDLHAMTHDNIASDGTVEYVRSKTGKLVVTAMPRDLVPRLPDGDPIWPLKTSGEYFRRQFQKIVKAAGLRGTFKKLRKSCGTSVDKRFPGRGHEHLGNSRKVFDLHYRDRRAFAVQPMLPEPVAVKWKRAKSG